MGKGTALPFLVALVPSFDRRARFAELLVSSPTFRPGSTAHIIQMATVTQPSGPKLSICIATFNRAEFLQETLENITAQATCDCEVIVSDNASTDNTEQIVSSFLPALPQLRYFKHPRNIGVDRNFDYAVEMSRGTYCWLFPDDDLLRPGAVARVLEALRQDLSLVVMNIEFRTFDMAEVLQRGAFKIRADRVYREDEMDHLFMDLDAARVYIGNLVVKREIWVARNRERYFGSLFTHVGTIFQEHLPGKSLAIAEPLVSYRTANTHSYSTGLSEAWLVKWPAVVESLAISKATKKSIWNAEPWLSPKYLLLMRARGLYSLNEYRLWIQPKLGRAHQRILPLLAATLPGTLVNTLFVIFYFIRRDLLWLNCMSQSPFYFRKSFSPGTGA
jgi:abequosyltransferase